MIVSYIKINIKINIFIHDKMSVLNKQLEHLSIKSWADEYDSDMDDEWKPDIISYNNLTKKEEIDNEKKTVKSPLKFSDKICERKCNIDYTKFDIVENSGYSCLMPWYVNQVNAFLKDVYIKKNIGNVNVDKVQKIIDTGANIGVDSINLMMNFPKSKLIAYEIDNHTYNVLCNNFVSYSNVTRITKHQELINSKSKVQAYNQDFMKCLDCVYNSDIVFIDAPWGGKIYKDKTNISVYLQPEDEYYKIHRYDESKNIINVTKTLLNKKYNIKSVILKVPYNYEFSKFNDELNKYDKNVRIHSKNVYKGNTEYIAFVLILVYISN